MKVVNYSWWIGAIISPILTVTLTGGSNDDDIGMLVLIGVINGIFWGWLIGFIIDKARDNPNKNDLAPISESKSVKINMDSPTESNKSPLKSEGTRARIDTLNSKEIVIETFQKEMDRLLANYMKKNATAMDDPLFGPLKIMNFMKVTSEEFKNSLLRNRDKFKFSNEEIDEIIKKVHSDTSIKTLH